MKKFLKNNFFEFASNIYLLTKIIKLIRILVLYKINKIPLFTFSYINKFCNLAEINSIAALGIGYTINELTYSDYESFKNMLSIGFGRWYYNDFVPNIIYTEFPKGSETWRKEFIKSMNEREESYKNTMILLHVNDENFKLHKSIIYKFSPKLRGNIRFAIFLTSMNDRRFPDYFLKQKFVLFLLKKLNILFHCRSSSFIGASLALNLKKNNLILAGIDGYSGYFIKDPNHKFNKISVSKNMDLKLHSTANPDFGRPTITEAFIAASKHLKIFIKSENSLLSKYITNKIDS